MTSNKACCWILGILAGGFVLTILIFAWGVSRAMSGAFSGSFSQSNLLKKDTWLLLAPTGDIADYHIDPDFAFWSDDRGSSLNEMLRALRSAAQDDQISGVIIRPQGSVGFATLRELRDAISDFKSSGKPVYAHLDLASDRDYYLASVADSIFLMPGGMSGISFGGIAFNTTYLKGTFEKLGIKFHVLHAGRFKGALEELAKDSMSAELRASYEFVFSDLFERYLLETSESRSGLSYADLRRELLEGEQLILGSKYCLSRGYVDALEEWPVLRNRLKGSNEEFESISAKSYLRKTRHKSMALNQTKVAVLHAEGEISFGNGGVLSEEGITADRLTKDLEELGDDEDVKAVVLRVNSPGGSALASKQILEAVKRVKQKKPVVVSMGRVAASGGYYISAAADEIVAEPNSLTGSIGVVTALPSAEELFKKLGARVETISYGRWANFFRLDRSMTAEQERVLRDLIDSVYDEFKQDVMEGRGLTADELDSVAEGRIWTGSQALERRLVDTLGGVQDAVEIAARRAGLTPDDYGVSYYPKQRDFFEFVAKKLMVRLDEFELLEDGLRHPEDPRTLIRLLSRYFDRAEFLQTLLPMEFNL